MKHISNRRSGLFLLELMIAVLFFSISSAVCVQVFVKSHTLSKEAAEYSQAVQLASGYAERFLGSESLDEQSSSRFFYDENWKSTTQEDAPYSLLIQLKKENGLLHGTFSVYSKKNNTKPIYCITTGKYDRGEGDVS